MLESGPGDSLGRTGERGKEIGRRLAFRAVKAEVEEELLCSVDVTKVDLTTLVEN